MGSQGQNKAGNGSLLTPLHLLALGAREPDWEFLETRLLRKNYQLEQRSWSRDLLPVLKALRTAPCDCLLLSLFDDDDPISNEELSSFIAAMREFNDHLAILVLSSSFDVELVEILQEHQCTFHQVHEGWFSSVTAVFVEQALQFQSLRRQNKILSAKQEQREFREQEEANILLNQQQSMLSAIVKDEKSLSDSDSDYDSNEIASLLSSSFLSGSATHSELGLTKAYEETLRSFVIMGSNRLGNEITLLVRGVEQSGCTVRDILVVHLHCVRKLMEGLGQRSTKHVHQRADQFMLEILVALAETNRASAA